MAEPKQLELGYSKTDMELLGFMKSNLLFFGKFTEFHRLYEHAGCNYSLVFWFMRLRVQVRRRRFEPRSHPRWRIVEVSNRPPNLSAKQLELTVRTKKPSTKEKKVICLGKKRMKLLILL